MRQICEIVNAGMQPLQNLSTLRSLNLSKDKEKEYVEAMMLRGVAALEQLVDESSDFCLGSTLTMADVFFVPQMRNVVDRFKIDVSAYPRVTRHYGLLNARGEYGAACHNINNFPYVISSDGTGGTSETLYPHCSMTRDELERSIRVAFHRSKFH